MLKQKIKTLSKGLLEKLNLRFQLLSYRLQFLLIFTACLSLLIMSVLTLANAISAANTSTLKVQKVHLPAHILRDQSKNDSILSWREFIEIEAYEHYLDSLSKTTNEKHLKDSLLDINPGLRDSLQWLEHIYQSQNQRSWKTK